ncbi:MAG: molybdopterin-binding protein [Myxococcota bacterium]
MNPPAPTASCVVIGNEILTGKVRDSNAHHLARWLRERGVDLRRIQVIPDEVDIIAAVVAEESARSHAVFTSGGIGPTHDDVTYRGVAAAFGLPVKRNETLAALMRNHYGERLTEVGLRMADLPDPCLQHAADGLWVPVVQVRNVYVLPGIPVLFERLLASLDGRFRGVRVRLASIYTHQREEEIAPALEAVLSEFRGVEIGSYPQMGGTADYRVRVTLECRDQDLCRRATDALLERLNVSQVVRVERDPG